MLAKAAGLAADEVFLDLEDAVAPESKNDDTRRLVVGALLGQEWTATTRAVRVNAVGTPWWRDDPSVVVPESGPALHCVIVPKVESVEHVDAVSRLLDELDPEGRVGIEIQIESPRGLVEIERLAVASPPCQSTRSAFSSINFK
jgi:citrate lyase subunit beta/citryl-CoA lyase